ncbi:transposase [Anaerobaca lacustris]|uniref:Transposase IS200-like domain-containing protein n=1 Tax=Anaerobaca lacustris TaxID=3044600 RepID=A0AAW6U588_9BACT|nr:hypothetical protein [Sedimentisphaerales bacterium M17dextr]
MTYDPKKHHRRSIRWFAYNYTQAGAYFVTICVQGQTCLFGDIIDGQMRLSDGGNVVQAAWDELPDRYPGVETDAFVVMPNHIHAIILLTADPPVGAGPRACPEPSHPLAPAPRACPNETGQQHPRTGQPRGVAPTNDGRMLSLGDVVRRFKTWTTKQYADGVRHRGWPPFPGRLWQRNYYEHVIRNEESLNRIRQYIAANPASWIWDRENPQAQPNPQTEPQW